MSILTRQPVNAGRLPKKAAAQVIGTIANGTIVVGEEGSSVTGLTGAECDTKMKGMAELRYN